MANQQEAGARSLPAWLRWLVIALLGLGIFFRFYHLDYKVFWVDETHTALRSAGYRKAWVADRVFTAEVITVETLQQYQRPRQDQGWQRTWRTLRSSAEHSPLYFVLARAWVELWGFSVANLRSLSAVLSLLVFPAVFWLGWELFASSLVGWIAIGLVAISPLHLLYAQEARPYSLLTVATLLSSASLLWALRTQNRKSWIAYGATAALGFYTQLLFALATIAHGLYVLLREPAWQQGRWSAAVRAYGCAIAGGLLAFLPWLLVLLTNLGQVQSATVSLRDRVPLLTQVQTWVVNLSRVFGHPESLLLGAVLLVMSAIAFYHLCRHTSRQAWLFLVLLAAVSALPLVLPDLLGGGQRSLRIRYLIPCYLSIQIVLAYWFARQAVWVKNWQQQLVRVSFMGLIVAGIAACLVSSQSEMWWNKEPAKTGYYPAVANLINQANKPLVITDTALVDTIAFSYRLNSHVKLQLVEAQHLNRLQVPTGFDAVFLLVPTPALRSALQQQNYQLTPLYSDQFTPEPRLWSVTRSETANPR
jgi:uncharacterized membrane protein